MSDGEFVEGEWGGTRVEFDCPECGERMLDDSDGMTGAPYFCANGHRAILYYTDRPASMAPTCPECGKSMLYVGTLGSINGDWFCGDGHRAVYESHPASTAPVDRRTYGQGVKDEREGWRQRVADLTTELATVEKERDEARGKLQAVEIAFHRQVGNRPTWDTVREMLVDAIALADETAMLAGEVADRLIAEIRGRDEDAS